MKREVSSKTFIIEFVGIGGVGKTTLCSEVFNEMRRRKIECIMYPPLEKRRILMNSIFKSFMSLIRSIKLAIILSPLSINKVFYIFRRLIILDSKYKFYNRKPNIYLEDEGFFQKVRAISRNSNQESMFEVAIQMKNKKIDLPNFVIIVESESDIIKRRLNERATNNISRSIVEKSVEDFKYTIECIHKFSNVNSHMNYISVNNNNKVSLELLAKEIVNKLSHEIFI